MVKEPRAGQVWWTCDGGNVWRIVVLESHHPHLYGSSWHGRDIETWRSVWLSEER